MKTKRILNPTTLSTMMKLRETRKQHIHELNSLQIEKSFLLLKINDLEDKLLETQL
jgi:hypothetical protein